MANLEGWKLTFGFPVPTLGLNTKVTKDRFTLTHLAIGEQHFHDLQGAFGLHSSLKNYVVRDKEKKEKCSAAGLRLVTIPYWWDGKKESLTDILYEEEVRS